jgi:uncharacterized membrane protein
MMDLILVLLLTIITIPLVLFTDGVPRIVLGVIVLLVFTGYSLVSALFPAKSNLKGIERAGLTLVLSFAVVALTGLALNYTPWGIRLTPIVISVNTLIILFCAIALFRRANLPPEERFSISLKIDLSSWTKAARIDKALYLCLALVVIGALSTLGYVIARPKAQEAFTNFYILGPGGMMENYPSDVILGQTAEISIGIENHENQNTSYRIETVYDGQKVETPAPIVLVNEGTWSSKVVLRPYNAGDNQKVEFLLYKNQESNPYLTLRLWLDVKQK